MSSNNQLYKRYSRQIALKEFGEAGQEKLWQAKVLVIGAGGLGCAALQYLVAAGIGTIGIIDDDIVSLSNLHRQPLYGVKDIGLPKAMVAANVLQQLNPDTQFKVYNERLSVTNALDIIGSFDIVVDGSDNFSTRYMVNDACVLLHKTLVYGAVSKFEGQVAVFNHSTHAGQDAVNYRDLFPEPPAAGEVANCAEAGVLGVLPGIIGTMQAGEAIKLIAGIGTPLVNSLLTYNSLNNQVFELQLSARAGTRKLIPRDAAAFEAMDYNWLCGVVENKFEIDSEKFNALRTREKVLVIDVREKGEMPPVTEFKHSHIPLGSIAEKVDANGYDTVIVFCQSGKRSLQAAGILAGHWGDTKQIFSLAGGIVQWKTEN